MFSEQITPLLLQDERRASDMTQERRQSLWNEGKLIKNNDAITALATYKKYKFYASNQDRMIIGAGVLRAAVLWRLHTHHGGWKSIRAKNSGGENKSPGFQWFSEK